MQESADLGLAFDGDGDRLGIVDPDEASIDEQSEDHKDDDASWQTDNNDEDGGHPRQELLYDATGTT